MYKWPQGRIVRVAVLVLVGLLTIDLAWGGVYAYFNTWATDTDTFLNMTLVYWVVYAVLAIGVGGYGVYAVGFQQQSAQFLIEVEQEMTRVDWPEPNHMVRSTIMIAIITAALGGVVFLVDWLCSEVIRLFMELGKLLG